MVTLKTTKRLIDLNRNKQHVKSILFNKKKSATDVYYHPFFSHLVHNIFYLSIVIYMFTDGLFLPVNSIIFRENFVFQPVKIESGFLYCVIIYIYIYFKHYQNYY